MEHHVKASSFADPKDVAAFYHWRDAYLDEGMTLEAATRRAFKKGDNGEGCWGDDTTEGSGPSCALPPEDLVERWGETRKARLKEVKVSTGEKQVICAVKDRMPHKGNIQNGAGIDLNPDAVRALGHEPHNFMLPVVWQWV